MYCAPTTAACPLLAKRGRMLFSFVLFVLCFPASTGFLLDGLPHNATVDIPLIFTWHLQGDDSDKFRFSLRNVSHGLEEVEKLPFSLPENGTRQGTLQVKFQFPGSYLIEAIKNETNEVIFSSSPISIRNAEFGVSLVPTSSDSTSVTASSITISSAVSASSISVSHSANGMLSSISPVSTESVQKTADTLSVEYPFSFTSPSFSSPESTSRSSAPSRITEVSSTGGATLTSTAVTPTSTSDNSNSRQPHKVSIIIGAVIGVIGFLLLLLIGVAIYRRLHRNRSRAKLPSHDGTFSYLEIRPPSQARLRETIQSVRVNAAPVSASSPSRMSASTNSFMLDVEGGPEIDLLTNGRETVMGMRRVSATSDFTLPVPYIFHGFSSRSSVQSLEGDRPVSQPSTRALQFHGEKDEMARNITGFRSRMDESASVCEQDSETEPPPVYVSRETSVIECRGP